MGCGGSKEEGGDAPAAPKTESASSNAAVNDGPLSDDELKQRLMGSEAAETFSLGSTGFSLRYAALSQRGYYPDDLFKANQDRFLVKPNMHGRSDQIFLGVFDGHGPEGDLCSNFVRTHVISELDKQSKRERFRGKFNDAYLETYRAIDAHMHDQDDFSDAYSGTTAISAVFKGTEMHIANIGDSRAIIGERKGPRVVAYHLSVDQTPYRRDERDRVKASGALIMTNAMVNGEVEYEDGWEDNMMSEELDGSADPPRIYAPEMWGPGCAFTRSIGDAMAAPLGVFAEAELLHKQLREADQFLALASDGVWEFLTNQSVCDTIMSFDDPLEACRSVISQSYSLWLQFDTRTDDITLIVAYIDTPEGKAPRSASEAELAEYEAALKLGKQMGMGAAEGVSMGLSVVGAGSDVKPVRRGLSAEKKKEMGVVNDAEEEDDHTPWKMEVVKKTKDEIERIKSALKGNFLFQHLPDTQAKQIYDVMKRTEVEAGQVVIKQGDKGDAFFVLDDGEYKVTIESDGQQVEILRYKPNPTGANPCFGELALMYSKPRAATVTALTHGRLWEIDRRSFREILKKSSTKYLMRTLRSVEVLKSLSVRQLQRLSEVLTEVTYQPGDFVITQGEDGDTFYIVSEGKALVTKNDSAHKPYGKQIGEIFQGQYFGERALLKQEPRAANVIADWSEGAAKLRILYIGKKAFEEVLGPLQKIIDDDATYRYKIALLKQLKKKAQGLSNAKVSDFDIEATTTNVPPLRYMLASHKKTGKKYTLKVTSKKQVVQMNLQTRLRNEFKLSTQLHGHSKFLPLSLQTMEDDSYIYSVLSTRVITSLGTILEDEDTGVSEDTAMFMTAVIASALEHLHEECPSTGGIIYRNLEASAITIDEAGWPQLIDMRYAVQAEPAPRDFCGQSHLLSPEQIRGDGHGTAVDFWALGLLIYDMVVMGNPWLTGDPGKDSELAIYNRVTAHKGGYLKFPNDVTITAELIKIINEFLEPGADERLGCRKEAVNDIRQHEWFGNFNEGAGNFPWDEIKNGTFESPLKKLVVEKYSKLAKNDSRHTRVIADEFNEVYEGDEDVFSGILDQNTKKSAGGSLAEALSQGVANKRRKAELENEKQKRKDLLARAARGEESPFAARPPSAQAGAPGAAPAGAPAAAAPAADGGGPAPALPAGAPSQDLPPPIASVRRQSTKVPPKIEPVLKDEIESQRSDTLKNVLSTTPVRQPDPIDKPSTPQSNSTEALLARLKVAQKLSADKVIDQPDKPTLATPEALNTLMRKMSGLVATLTPKDDSSKKYTALGAVAEGAEDVTA